MRGLVFVQGTFDRERVLKALRAAAQTPLTKITYKGKEVYSYSKEGQTCSLAFLSASQVVLGEEAWVRAALDVQPGVPPLAGDVREGFKKLGYGHLLKAYVRTLSVGRPETPPAIGGSP